jgi:UDPglucose 6-dehydrogenase
VRVCVIGTGHVGLVTCASLAAVGHEVAGVEKDPEKLDALSRGVSPFYEPGLQELLDQSLGSGRLKFFAEIKEGIPDAEVIFICVGTPARATGEANLIAVERAASEAVHHVPDRAVLVEKSTVPAGTAHRVKRSVQRERPELVDQIEVVSNPEFLREGKAVEDALEPDRILVGAESEWAFEVMRKLYEPFTSKGAPLIETDIPTAELSKHACNAFLALKISYINGLARLCERSGADVEAVAEVMGSDERIGRAFLNAGLGYGGYCFPKDIQAFERLAARVGYEFPLLHEVARINDQAIDAAIDKIREAMWNLEEKRIALWGLSFKPGTDDVRFAPALALASKLLEENAVVVGYDPQANPNAKNEVPELEVASDPYEAVKEAHCVVLCTEWDEFNEIDLKRVKELLAYPVVVDGRNFFNREQMYELGFTYYPTGRPFEEQVL